MLLLQLVGDDSESGEPRRSRRATRRWAPTLVERFGAIGVGECARIAARFPEPETFGWMRRLGDLVERGVIAREHAAPVRALAAHR